MKPSFCAIANRQTGEDLIGTAGHYQAYVLIECPRPWAAKVFKSEVIPSVLRDYIKAIKAERSVQFLAIDRSGVDGDASDSMTLMVYEKTVPSNAAIASAESVAHTFDGESVKRYRGYEFQLDDLTQVVDCLEAHWQGNLLGKSITRQDILVCTHGMRDKCCARFGQPFFREAVRSAHQGKLPNARIWRVSHIGGHRFAPTAISFPDGRYYGHLTIAALQAMVTRSSDISRLSEVYRGWGLLPTQLQVLERQLLLQYGWSWFERVVNYQILTDRQKGTDGQPGAEHTRELGVEVSVSPEVSRAQAHIYRAKIVQDPQKTVCTKPSCSSAVAVPIVKYTVAECVRIESEAATVSSVAASEILPHSISQGQVS